MSFTKPLRIALLVLFPVAALAADPNIIEQANSLCNETMSVAQKPIQSCQDFVECNQQERVRTACEMRLALTERYSPVFMKEQRLPGFHANGHLSQCIVSEAAIEGNANNLEFIDRMILCVAGLKDTHLDFGLKKPRPLMFTGIETFEVEGKIVISRRSKKILSFIETQGKKAYPLAFGETPRKQDSLMDILAIGNEVVRVDGVEASRAADALAAYESSSTPQYARLRAVRALVRRDYRYPTKNYLRLEVKSSDGTLYDVNIPWFIGSDYRQRFDTRDYVKQTEINSSEALQWDYDSATNTWNPVSGTDPFEGMVLNDPIIPEKYRPLLTTYADKKGSNILRMGTTVAPNGHAVCYLQVLGFSASDNAVTVAGSDAFVPFIDPIVEFVNETCKLTHLPLILDLHQNGGGNAYIPTKLLAALAPTGALYRTTGSIYPVNQHIADLLYYPVQSWLAVENDADLNEFLLEEWIKPAAEAGKPFTDIITGNNITPDPRVGGFDEPLVVIITPMCVSACDMTAALFKQNGHGTLIGTQSNGTGAGFFNDAGWHDSTSNYEVRIPNSLFGVVPVLVSEGRNILSFDEHWDATNLENRPTVVDAPNRVEWTVADLQGKKFSYYDKAIEIFGYAAKASEPAEVK